MKNEKSEINGPLIKSKKSKSICSNIPLVFNNSVKTQKNYQVNQISKSDNKPVLEGITFNKIIL